MIPLVGTLILLAAPADPLSEAACRLAADHAKQHQGKCCLVMVDGPAYGLTWWLKKTVPDKVLRSNRLLESEWGGVCQSDWLPGDLVAACGAGKQRLYVIPCKKLVVVRTGNFGRGYSDEKFLSALLRGTTGDE